MSDSKLVEKIRKLLALAADTGASANEAESAARMATRLMLKHGIEQSAIDAANGKRGAVRCAFAFARHMNKGCEMPKYVGLVAIGVARFLGTIVSRMYKPDADGRNVEMLKFGGEIGDVKFSVWLSETLFANALREWQAYDGEADRKTWLCSWASAVQARLVEMGKIRESEEAEIRASDSTALVVIDAKKSAVSEKFGDLKIAKANIKFSQDGYEAGKRTSIPSGAIGNSSQSHKAIA